MFETLPISPTEKAAQKTDFNFRPSTYFLMSETETEIQEALIMSRVTEVGKGVNKF